MYEDRKNINIDRLRNDMKNESYGAAFVGGYGGAFIEALDIERASDSEVVKMARDRGIDLDKY